MSIKQPFFPHYGTNQVITAASSAASVSLDKTNKQVRIYNSGAALAYVRLYDNTGGTQSATTADLPVGPGQVVVITKSEYQNALSHISATGTTLQVMTGEGW